MNLSRQPAKFVAVLALAAALLLFSGLNNVTRAAADDVAMFYDDLSQYGQWADYENYGPVWRPDQVSQEWRPYTNGRWVPTDNGYVFETQEPWGWATYHYGNWMPTQEYGWVWVPGRTWYPSTVEWRTSPENASPDDSYVGWAPIPPANYEPPPDYAASSYSPGSPIVDALTAPFWIFVKAASFLLGLGQPYAPAYSYVYSGVLLPPPYVQVFYPQTVIVRRYYTPAYYPPAYFGGRRLGFAAYNWGPPPAYCYRHARINRAAFNRALLHNSAYITRMHNVTPPSRVTSRYGYIRQIVPPALAQGRALPPSRRITNYRTAQANLSRPNALPAPRQVPQVKAHIPRLTPAAGFQRGHRVSHAAPARAGKVAPGVPRTPGFHSQPARVYPARVPAGQFRPVPAHTVAPRATQPRPTLGTPAHRNVTPAAQQKRYQKQYQQVHKTQVRQQPVHQQPQVRRQAPAQVPQHRRPPQFQQHQQYQRAQHRQVQPQVRHQPVRSQVRHQPAPHPQSRVQPRPQSHSRVQPRPQPQHQQQHQQPARHRQNPEQQ
jgi:hypothetical protein